ncbi:tRNA ligase 1-like, partial [Prosopis cineraria]|uniref:tRNA ligase 1-like n=1 Tax=Prosopis cineraria TaxID=364024 RepID=UPI00240FB4FD
MSATQRIVCALSHSFPCSLPPISSSSSFKSPSLLFLPFSRHHRILARSVLIFPSPMPLNQRAGRYKEPKWQEKPKADRISSATTDAAGAAVETITHRLSEMHVAKNSGQTSVPAAAIQFGGVQTVSQFTVHGSKTAWKPKSYGTVSETTVDKVDAEVASTKSSIAGLSRNDLIENFTVDNSTYSLARIRATFYPKFENEKSDQEIRARMIEMVSKGLATLEVSLKHSGSLFMYAGHKGGAYAKNSFGNIYTAVGVFVLGRMFREAWGTGASKKQVEFNEFLERNHMCISMELVTAVLGDHGQRPKEDLKMAPTYKSCVVVSTRKSVSSFLAAFDALCEEGTLLLYVRLLTRLLMYPYQ